MAGYAVGLGRLTVNSAQGHSFKAEIELVAVKKEEKPSLMARLASQETYRQANIDYSSVLSTFNASIETRSDGQPYVRIMSPQPIAEPFLNMLVELNWSTGRLLREYTVLPSPSEIDAHPPSESVVGKSDASVKQDEKLPIQDESNSASKTHTAYGPVKQGDTLVRIAKNIVFPAGVSLNQMLVALHRANCDAFFGNNMNQLKTGPILRIPDNSEIGAITQAEANREVKAQTANWYRRRFADREGATEELKQTVGGRIEPAVEVDIIPAQELSRETLKLSKVKKAGMGAHTSETISVGSWATRQAEKSQVPSVGSMQ
ncbi:type IV pilus assembly protein FimV [Nitrosospira briensis]|uniref:type IV pilus assembly protein FimV n=1 Tax=Nitrosospira briensis TaxID=35799 RepID=UPI0012E2C4F3|nr:FimV/HubP family polar landmark protein [Nitrosospira briensis]